MSSATGFTIKNNVLVGNTSFIGVRGENCSMTTIPSPAPFVLEPSKVQQSTTQPEFESVVDANGLVVCVVPPVGEDQWPFGTIGSASPEIDLACKASETLAGPQGRRLDSRIIMFGLFVVAIIASFVAQILASRRRVPRLGSCRKHVASCKCSAGDIESTRVCSA